MSTTGKTPVSHLNEMLIRKGLQPIYNLQQSGVGTNQGIFVYEVTAGNLVTAVGHGRSKKEAKQNAAKAALSKMRPAGETTPEPMDEDLDISIEDLEVVSPYAEVMKENAVGNLLELCAFHDMPLPEYEQIREDGPPHAKHFEVSCKVSCITEFAVGRTKRQAKQLAALNMLQKLDQLRLTDELKNKPKPLPEFPAIEETIVLFNEARGDGVRFPLGLKIGQGLKHDWTEEQINYLQALSAPFSRPMETMQALCEQLGIDMDVVEVETVKSGNMAVMLTLSTLPENILPGLGPTQDAAMNDAASRAINFLQVMTCA